METNNVGIGEAAQYFGVSSKTIRRWIQSGRLSAQKLYKGKGYEYLVDISGNTPGQIPSRQITEDVDISPETEGQTVPVIENLSIALEAKDELIKHLQEEITEKNRQIGEILLVLRQTQVLLPEATQKKRWWWPFSKSS